MSYEIVPMTAEHLPQIVALERICFAGEAWSESLFRDALERPDAALLAAVDETGTVLGYAMLSAVWDEGNLDNIAVAPRSRRLGVADAMLDVLTGYGRKCLAFLTLEVRASNAPAIALYQKHGFVPVGRRRNYYSTPKEDAILMTLEFEHETETAESI